MEALTVILGLVTISSVVGGSVWVVATIKGRVDALVEAIGRLTTELDKLSKQAEDHGGAIDLHDERIKDHERRIDRLEVVKE